MEERNVINDLVSNVGKNLDSKTRSELENNKAKVQTKLSETMLNANKNVHFTPEQIKAKQEAAEKWKHRDLSGRKTSVEYDDRGKAIRKSDKIYR